MDLDASNWTEKKLAIVRATITIAGRFGLEGLSTSRIAADAKVSEGTIYRHFKSKDALVDVGAQLAAADVTAEILKNYDRTTGVETQFSAFCRDFLRSGIENRAAHDYLQQYVNSPQGKNYRRLLFRSLQHDPEGIRPLFYPLNIILVRAKKEKLLKDQPLPLLGILVLGQLIFVVRDGMDGMLPLDDNLMSAVAESCWDAICL